MSTSKKSLGKRKRQSPPPLSTTSQISRRLEKLRGEKRNLWGDDNDHDEGGEEPAEEYLQSKNKSKTTTDNTYIVLSDSDDERTSSRKRSRSNKSKKKSSRIQDENFSSDNDNKMPSKCPTCLICSILSTLTSYNCCSKHLAVLVHNKSPHHHHHRKQTTNSDQWPPQQVMIVPMTDELIQRYINPQEIYRLKTRTSLSSGQKKTSESKRSTRKLSKKSTTASEPSDTEHANPTKPKSPTKATHMETEQISSSSSMIDSSLPNSQTNPPDVTYTVITSTSTTINSFESPNVLDTCQLQQSSDQPIVIDDSQPDNQQDNLLSNNTNNKKQNDPWTTISDDTYAAIETALEQVDRNSQEEMEFTPAIARRTPTELMASRLPKIQLKKGRYHRGKPVADKNTLERTTSNESDSTIISQSSSSSASTSVITTNTRLPPSLATIIEDESLVIQSTRQNSEKTSQPRHLLSNRHDNTTELDDTVMSGLLAQDESSQHDIIHSTTTTTTTTTAKLVSNDALPPTLAVNEHCIRENDSNKSANISQSSQLTNDQNDTQPLISSTTNEKPTTPARISYRLNPDGSRVSISRPPLSTNHQSPIVSSRRTSTDVIHFAPHLNKEKL